MDPGQARNYLAAYLFRGEDIDKAVGSLSGGERTRLALAILALDGANFLLLDEPTNHLDIPAREALQEVLEDFNGTILMVSHDRYLIDRLATRIWELRGGQMHDFQGNYREFVLRRVASASPGSTHHILLTPKPLVRDNSRETRKRTQNLERIEERIRQQEQALQRLSTEMQKAGKKQAFEHVHQLSWQVSKAQATLDELLSEWEELAV
jgi:ATP-binding cassette subfamily F protein 3